MNLDLLNLALNEVKDKPKAIKVSPTMWEELREANLITMRRVAAWGVFDLGFDVPCYQDIMLIYDSSIDPDDQQFVLPPNVIN